MSLKQRLLDKSMGFIGSADLPGLIEEDRFMKILVRCGGGRFIVPVQDAEHFMDIIDASGKEYVRDASIYIEK